ncbi:MAG TPA: ABC transporter substrate-binding protein [Propionibacteriaceae bacterium]|nr:ABC transporter substrate-binding protein [Propionibacteriaceae bacterium]
MRKRALAVAAAMLLIAGCGTSDDSTTKSVEIGISQIVSHPSLDLVRSGFQDRMKELGYVEGTNVTYDYQNPQGDQAALTNIANTFTDKDLVVAISTPVAQAMAQAVTDKPILFAAVTDPVAAGLVTSWEKPGANITGTSDMNPIDEQLALVKDVAPDAKTVGIVYSSAESNSEVQVTMAKAAAAKMGLEIKTATVTNSSEVQQAAKSLDVDAFYVPTDNTVVSALESLLQVAEASKTPVVSADGDSVKRGVLASVAVDYYKMGQQTADMAVKILKDGVKPADIPVETQSEYSIVINPAAATRIGITLPESLTSRATETITG